MYTESASETKANYYILRAQQHEQKKDINLYFIFNFTFTVPMNKCRRRFMNILIWNDLNGGLRLMPVNKPTSQTVSQPTSQPSNSIPFNPIHACLSALCFTKSN